MALLVVFTPFAPRLTATKRELPCMQSKTTDQEDSVNDIGRFWVPTALVGDGNRETLSRYSARSFKGTV